MFPAHSFKFAAALQNADPHGKPILIRIDLRTGHGGGKPGRFHVEHLLCERDRRRQVIGTRSMGRAFWEREPGADDK